MDFSMAFVMEYDLLWINANGERAHVPTVGRFVAQIGADDQFLLLTSQSSIARSALLGKDSTQFLALSWIN